MKDVSIVIRGAARAAAELIRKQYYRGALKCDVCGRRVKLNAECSYIIKEPEAPLSFLTVAPRFSRVVDCPYCANQIKYAKYVPAFPREEECDDEEGGDDE